MYPAPKAEASTAKSKSQAMKSHQSIARSRKKAPPKRLSEGKIDEDPRG